jgi:hypothetical protein
MSDVGRMASKPSNDPHQTIIGSIRMDRDELVHTKERWPDTTFQSSLDIKLRNLRLSFITYAKEHGWDTDG